MVSYFPMSVWSQMKSNPSLGNVLKIPTWSNFRDSHIVFFNRVDALVPCCLLAPVSIQSRSLCMKEKIIITKSYYSRLPVWYPRYRCGIREWALCLHEAGLSHPQTKWQEQTLKPLVNQYCKLKRA